MTGRHRHGAARAVPAHAHHIKRLVTDEVADHRHAGRYLAVRDARVLAASLNAPERRRRLTHAGGVR